jgi:aliphatic nitrilase
MGPGEGILYCDVDTQDVIIPKLIHDFAGHYNRPDIFTVAINAEERRLARVVTSDDVKLVGGGPNPAPSIPDERSAYYLEAPKVVGDGSS